MFQKRDNHLEYLKIAQFGSHAFGIDFLNTKDGKIIKQPIKFMIVFLLGLCYAILVLIYAVLNCDDMVEVSICLCVLTPWTLSIIKLLLFIFKRKEHIQLIEDLIILAEKANVKEKKILLKENKQALLVTRIYFFCCYGAVGVWLILPGIIMCETYAQTGQFILEPPYRGVYIFYDFHKPLYYTISFAMFYHFLRTIVDGALHVDSLLCWYIQNISAHFLILQDKFKSAAQELKEAGPSLDFRPKFISAIVYHRYVIRLTDDLNRVYALIVLTEISFSSFQICMFVFQGRSGPESYELPTIIFCLLGMSVQLSIYCIGGQKFQNLSDMTPNIIYMYFPWEIMRPQEKRLLLIPLMRAQRTITLSGYFFITNNNLLVAVFKTAFSISALFAAMNNKMKNDPENTAINL